MDNTVNIFPLLTFILCSERDKSFFFPIIFFHICFFIAFYRIEMKITRLRKRRLARATRVIRRKTLSSDNIKSPASIIACDGRMWMPLRRHAYLPTWVWPIWSPLYAAHLYTWIDDAPSEENLVPRDKSVSPEDTTRLWRIDRIRDSCQISGRFSGTICEFSLLIVQLV